MHQLDHHGSGNLWKLTEPATNTQLPIFRYNVHRSTRQHRSYRVSRQLARFRKIKVTSNRGSHQMKAQDKHGNWFPGVYYEQGKTSNAQSLSFIPPFSFCGVVTLSQSPFSFAYHICFLLHSSARLFPVTHSFALKCIMHEGDSVHHP